MIAASAAAVLIAGAVTTGALLRTAESTAEAQAGENSALETRMQTLVDAGYPAVLASVTEPDGDVVDVAVGAGNVDTGAQPPIDGEVRIASNTKMFVSTVVLQLVQEGRVDLDAPIDRYLPGLVTGDGIDGTRITVHQLLQQTTGLPEYADQIAADVRCTGAVHLAAGHARCRAHPTRRVPARREMGVQQHQLPRAGPADRGRHRSGDHRTGGRAHR
ncbi:beta-lactamase family protein [Microbacterium sp. ISL-108]|nr:beta-lactamase family protein [Microbacterium sp. ISL-108]